jgi:Phosphatidylinositol-specific phospholipase C, X domain
MTSKISFKEIIKALKLFVCFHPDTFPLILSFENHCSLPFQEVMADQLQSILGKSLYIPKEENLLLGRLPSPMEYVPCLFHFNECLPSGMYIVFLNRTLIISVLSRQTPRDDCHQGSPTEHPELR